MVLPRRQRLTWDDHHMLMALLTAQRSPDPNTQVGACIIDKHNRVVGLGYNGFPRGIGTGQFSWSREGDPLETKYPFVVHAESNAIHNSLEDRLIEGATVYVTMYPCNSCAKDIIQSGIHEVVYLTNPYKDQWSTQAADKMFQMLDIMTRQHKWSDQASLCLNSLLQTIS